MSDAIYGLTLADMLNDDELAEIDRWNAKVKRERSMMDADDVAFEAWSVELKQREVGMYDWKRGNVGIQELMERDRRAEEEDACREDENEVVYACHECCCTNGSHGDECSQYSSYDRQMRENAINEAYYRLHGPFAHESDDSDPDEIPF